MGQPIPSELFRQMFEASPDCFLIADAQGFIRWANPACKAVLGYPPAELESRSVEALVPERYRGHSVHRAAFAADPRARAMGSGVELYARTRSGQEVPVDIALTPLSLGERRFVAVAIRDMSDRSRTS